MALTTEQLHVFRAALLAETDPDLVFRRDNGQAGRVAEWYNQVGANAPIVWKTSLQLEEITSNGFDWVRVDNLSVGKARIWEWMRLSLVLNCGIANIRQGLNDAFSATTSTKLAVLAVIKRDATRAEEMFSTGTGSDGSPGTMTFVGNVTDMDVELALKG